MTAAKPGSSVPSSPTKIGARPTNGERARNRLIAEPLSNPRPLISNARRESTISTSGIASAATSRRTTSRKSAPQFGAALIVHRETEALVFRKDAGKIGKRRVQGSPQPGGQGGGGVVDNDGRLRIVANFGAMNGACSKAQRPEQPIEIFQRSSADESERAAKRPLDVGDAFDEPAGNNHGRRRRGKIEQGAVNIQEKRRPVGLERINACVQHLRSLDCP